MKFAWLAALVCLSAQAAETVPVTVDNFARAETHRFFSGITRFVGVGKFLHVRRLSPVESQPVVRTNRDTLYSAAVFDLYAGPVSITLPDSGGRFQSLQLINEDAYSPAANYKPGTYTFTKEELGTRYAFAIVRILFNPTDSSDIGRVHALQDAIKWQQNNIGKFEIPNWDPVSQGKVRSALLSLAATVKDSRGMFGTKDQVDPVRHLIGTATGWGGNHEKDALYLMATPEKNDGTTTYQLDVGQVPVDGFWSVSVYNANGYYEKNALDAYSLNNLTAQKNSDGTVHIQFGGCDGKIPNCLPTMAGWNYWVRLYLPRAEILDETWKFPAATELK